MHTTTSAQGGNVPTHAGGFIARSLGGGAPIGLTGLTSECNSATGREARAGGMGKSIGIGSKRRGAGASSVALTPSARAIRPRGGRSSALPYLFR